VGGKLLREKKVKEDNTTTSEVAGVGLNRGEWEEVL